MRQTTAPRTVIKESDLIELLLGISKPSLTNKPNIEVKMQQQVITDTFVRKVIFNKPATIVFFADGTKEVVKCEEGDTYSKEAGLALAISKKMLGRKGFHKTFDRFLQGED